ncbi:MAG: lipid asymmetry maintenance protein MlaB [Acidiferrobacterales bacterium]
MADYNQVATLEGNGDPLKVKGALTFATVPALASLAQHRTGFGKDNLVIDLADVTHSDSAGLALLLQWVAEIRTAGYELRFINIPHQVEDFIRINGLAQLLIR